MKTIKNLSCNQCLQTMRLILVEENLGVCEQPDCSNYGLVQVPEENMP